MAMKTISSIQEFISYKPTIATEYSNMSFIEERTRIQFAVNNLITDDYYDELKKICYKVYLSDDEVVKYRYRAKILAYDLYDNTELYYIILRVNDLYNSKDFNISKKFLYLPPKETLKNFLSDVYNIEKKNMSLFNSNHMI